jgi:hypothetical protein
MKGVITTVLYEIATKRIETNHPVEMMDVMYKHVDVDLMAMP